MVIIEHPAEALSPPHRVRPVADRAWLQESISETLMIALDMVVCNEVGDRVLKRGLFEEDHSVQALQFYRTHSNSVIAAGVERDGFPLGQGLYETRLCILYLGRDQIPRARRKPFWTSVMLRPIWVIHRLSGWGVKLAMCTDREAMSMKKRM